MSFLSNIFGGNSAPQINYQPTGITNPTGFSVSSGGNVTQSPALSTNIGALQQTYGNAATAFMNLGTTVQPGFSQGRTAGLNTIANQYLAANSNLQDTLAQRRILGSSFANASQSQLASQQAQDEANFQAQSYLQEFQAYNQVLQQQFNAATAQYSSAINQSNIESATAASLTASNNQIAAQIATANANLTAQAQAGAGSFLGTLLGVGTNALGGKGLFSSGGIFGGASTGGSIGTDATLFNDSTSSFLSSLSDAAFLAA